MPTLRSFRLLVMLFLILPLGDVLATVAPADTGTEGLKPEQLEALAGALEDPQQREQLILQLRLLAQAQQATQPPEQTVKSAASDAVEALSKQVASVAKAAGSLVDTLKSVPRATVEAANALRDPKVRERWIVIMGRLLAVLGAGFLAAWVTRGLLGRLRREANRKGVIPGLLSRLLHLTAYLVVDLLPILVFAATAYGILALVDPRAETRYVAVILINASILSRLVLAASAFLFAPDTPSVRLWGLSDETAHYIHQWVKRVSIIAIYGFFGLEAALFLGLAQGAYQMSLRLLGLVVLGLLLVLVAQNRQDIAAVIAGISGSAEKPLPQLSAMRKGLARVWHLVAGFYLIVVYAIWALHVEDGAWIVIRATALSLLLIAAAQLLLRGIDHLLGRGLRLSEEIRGKFPGLEKRLNRYFPVFSKIVKIVLSIFAAVLIADVWGLDALGWLTTGSGRVLVSAALNIFVIVAMSLVIWELARGGIERYLEEGGETARPGSARSRTLLTVARNAVMVVVIVIATLMVLSELGINIGPLLAGAGVVGLAVGFGSQRLVQDVINGAFILFQDLMAVGDVVKLGDKAGLVEAVSIRTVRLRDLSGTVHTIPFSSIDSVSNLTREFSFHVFDIGVAYREDVDEVISLLKQIGEELRADSEIGPLVLEPLEVFGLDAFGDSAVIVKGRIKTRPIKQWQVGRAFNRLVKQRFDEHGIEIPFPHRTLYFGQEKSGSAPPAFVMLDTQEPGFAPAARSEASG
jgi:small conductance mechanosensitive channel